MRYLLALLWIVPALAQQPPDTPPKPADQAAQAPAKTDDKAAQAPAKTDAKAESPAPATEQWVTGSVDLGYRWMTDIRGSFPQYRSVVNLGEGPKLFGLDFTITDPKKRLFDRLDARAYGWGGDPYSTARVDARKLGIYDFTFDYRNIAYFNAVPSFANPLAPAGFNEQAFDIHRRTMNIALDLLPGKRFTPYLAFDRNAGYGHGIDTFLNDENEEFAVPTLLRDSTANYRGGVHVAYNRFHVTLEQGGTTFKDDDQTQFAGTNFGDRTTAFQGQKLVLNSLQQAYGIRGHSIYSKVLVTASPFSKLDIYGQFLYSDPKTDVRYADSATGKFVNPDTLSAFGAQQSLATGSAVAPHTTGSVGFELRPFRRLRIIESWMTDRYHDTGFGLFNQVLQTTPPTNNITTLAPIQVVNYNQEEINALFDVTSKITLRGGYRHVWGDATVRAGTLSQTGDEVSGELRRNVGLAGLTVRPSQKLSVNLDYEAASSDRVYFRTSLNDYHRARVRAKYQVASALVVQANFQVLNNQNPSPDIRYDFESRRNSLAVFWTPAGSKRVSVMAEYDRSTLRSNISFLLPPFLTPTVSAYRDNAHTATSAVDLALVRGAKLTAGGSFFISSGSRPSRYYQPLMRLSVPFGKHITSNTEWQYYGFGEQFFLFEGFRTHVFMTGLRITR